MGIIVQNQRKIWQKGKTNELCTLSMHFSSQVRKVIRPTKAYLLHLTT